MDNATLEPPPKKLKRVNYALAATLLATGSKLTDELAVSVGAKNANVLRVGLTKRGISRRYTNSLPLPANTAKSHAMQIAAQATELIRDKLGGRLLEQAQELASRPVKRSNLANAGQGEAAVLKTLAETHKTLYGGADSQITIFGATVLSETPQQIASCGVQDEPVIDITPNNTA